MQSGRVLTENEAFLLQQIKELRYLVGVLLAQSGLDREGLVRAFELAHTETARLDEEMLDLLGDRFRQTLEGRKAAEEYANEKQQRETAAWREDCLDGGRIFPHPSRQTE